MPLVQSQFKPSLIFKNPFVSTVYSGLVRRVKIKQQRERLTLRDGDFLDLDWSCLASSPKTLVILLHGMEGHGQRPYITGAAKLFNQNNMDALCVNFRCCSGDLNLKFATYHSGKTDDLEDVIHHVLALDKYDHIYLKGISLGGNIILKYLGEGNVIPKEIKKAVSVSVPCFLSGSANMLHHPKNALYHYNFKRSLIKRLKLKQSQFPHKINDATIKSIKTLRDFDEVYTSKAHGFKDAQDYYNKSSSLQFLEAIKTPVLIINALNDSFLSDECYPYAIAQSHSYVYLETPKHGGHVGFIEKGEYYYNEKRALEFFLKGL